MASEKQNKLFSGDNKSCKHLKTSQFLNEFFKRFYAQITADFLIEAAHLPLRSAYGLWVLLKIFFGKLLKIAACGFSQNDLCLVEVLGNGQKALPQPRTRMQWGENRRSWPALRESHTRLYVMTASGRKSAATRTREHYLIISSLKRVDDQWIYYCISSPIFELFFASRLSNFERFFIDLPI